MFHVHEKEWAYLLEHHQVIQQLLSRHHLNLLPHFRYEQYDQAYKHHHGLQQYRKPD